MGLFNFFKKRNRNDSPPPVQRGPLNLRVNDIVTYDLEDYIVVGKITYNDSGYDWHAYHLKGDRESIWLAAEMDDELELGIYRRITTKITSVPDTLEINGVTYYQEEHGFARITEAVGQAGARTGQEVEYWDFESEDEQYLSVEKWGGDLEISQGIPIEERELKIIAGS
ncbi:MAG: DUF4178 domain-containing protein [Bacillaceae bacterium]|nr:DUF4178 domain-containing protein [Bacillaceae bacterium]